MNNIFLEYFEDEKKKSNECIKNYRNKRLIFLKNIDEKKYYIKKYFLPGRRGKMLALGLREDKVDKNVRISKELDKLKINHVKIVFFAKRKLSLFQNVSILVTEDGGRVFADFISEYTKYKELFINFFDLFIKLCKNNIYPDDYSYINVLVNERKELVLFDFDEYKMRKFFITNKFKKKILQNLKDCLIEEEMKKFDEFVKFSYMEIERVKKELGWDNICVE
ncbi:hypothetical protein [Fusobacterium sp. PH5-44]|uniref:hypothetical protein n=1 Tax=unclassified Fusobacterium TaxID=2648384 RepID=UPI003D224D38